MDTELPGAFTVTDDWTGIEHARNVLRYVKDGTTVNLLGRVRESGIMGEVEPYAVILPVSDYRALVQRG